MLFPLHDVNPTSRRPWVTWGLVVTNALVWLIVQGAGSEPTLSTSICNYGLISGEVLGLLNPGAGIPMAHGLCTYSGGASWFTVLSSMFMHGDWMHIIFNMWFLYVFGDNIEEELGHSRYLVFYLICGVAAAGAQMVTEPGSPVPMVGASGAIGGVMGAYVVAHPRARIHSFLFLGFFFLFVTVPAWVMLGVWIALQLFDGVMALGAAATGGVAFWAHIGGFAAGALFVKLLSNSKIDNVAVNLAVHEWVQPFFSLCGFVAKLDGRVTADEVAEAAHSIRELELSETQEKLARRSFNEGKTPDFRYEETISSLTDMTKGQSDLRRTLVRVLFRICAVDGELEDSELLAIRAVASRFDLPPSYLKKLERANEKQPAREWR